MATGDISNPILNSPFREPTRHFRFDDEGITNEIVASRRTSSYFVPIPAAKKKSNQQLAFNTEWTQDRIEENVFVNRIRARVGMWRNGGYAGVDGNGESPPVGRSLEGVIRGNRSDGVLRDLKRAGEGSLGDELFMRQKRPFEIRRK